MSENVDTAALLAALQGQLKAAQPSGWAQPQTAVPVIDKINVPIKMQTPIGEVRVGLEIPIVAPEMATPEGIMSILQWLQSQGMPIDAWQNRQWNNRNGGGEWGRGGNGGYGGGGRRW